MKKNCLFFSLLFIFPLVLFARKDPQIQTAPQSPWLTGPLITPSADVLPYPKMNLEVYFNAVVNAGQYTDHWHIQKNDHNFYANSVVPIFQFGLTSWMDFQVAPRVFYNYSNGAGSWAFGDLPIILDIQLFTPGPGDWEPSIKLILTESFPTGKYRKLKSSKNGTQVGGNGSFATTPGIAFGKLFDFENGHFMTLRLYFQYTFPAPVRLKGFNVYGGDATTNMKFVPSQSAQIDLGIEYTITQNWAFALDLVANWAKSANYSASPGTGILVNPQPVPGSGGDAIFILIETPATKVTGGMSPSLQYSMAPAIEYNWSQNLGLIVGSWFTVAGKNSVQFFSGIAALNYEY